MDIIFDIDGTLANGQHRQHHLTSTPKNWPAYQALAHLDTCHERVAGLLRSLALANDILLATGRGEQERGVTVRWLDAQSIPYERLYMRKEGDYRPDDIIKGEILDQMIADGFAPAVAFEDRDRVVKPWRRRGLVCAQVAEGDF